MKCTGKRKGSRNHPGGRNGRKGNSPTMAWQINVAPSERTYYPDLVSNVEEGIGFNITTKNLAKLVTVLPRASNHCTKIIKDTLERLLPGQWGKSERVYSVHPNSCKTMLVSANGQ